MTIHEAKILLTMLDGLLDKYSTEGCDDMKLPDTPENREIVLAAEKTTNPGEYHCGTIRLVDGNIYTVNGVGLIYELKRRLRTEFGLPD